MTNDKISIDRKTFLQLSSSVEEELASNHLHQAVGILQNLVGMMGASPWFVLVRERLQQTSDDYSRLLHYMVEGMEDPARESLQRRLLQKVFSMSQDLRRGYDLSNLNNIFTQTAQEYWNNWERDRLIPLLHRSYEGNYEAQDHLFNVIWTAPQLTSEEEEELKSMASDASTTIQCYILSALTLANIHYFDAAKIRVVEALSHTDTPSVKARAALALAIATYLHPRPFSIYPDLLDKNRKDKESSNKELTQLQHYLCLYLETERIHEKMEKEIIPTLIKVTQQRRKMGFDDMDIDFTDEDSTPNISRKDKKKLAEGIIEMARLSHEGMDINLPTFTVLKKFSFFQSVGHWLAPFTDERPEIPNIDYVKILPLCDNDKYSATLLHRLLPAEQREGLSRMLEAHEEMFRNEEVTLQKEFQNVTQCLYRLFKRSPWTSLWPDIFTIDMLFIDNHVYGPILQEDDAFLHETGMMLFRNKHYKEAERHLSLFAQHKGTDFNLLMQLGICAQEQGNFQKAVNAYRQANLLQPENPHALYRMQYCMARQEQYRAQLDILLELEKQKPDDAKITTETGLCLIQLEAWEEALKRFYKLEVMGKNVVPSMRAIAWCHLNMHQYDEAQKYYRRIAEEYPSSITWEDRLNTGHTTWALGDTKTALQHYTAYVRQYAATASEETNLLRPFECDHKLLTGMGFSKGSIGLMDDLMSRGIQ